MNYNQTLSQPLPEAAQPAHQDQQIIIANWLDQQPKILIEQDGIKVDYAETIIALRKRKFGA